MKFQPSAIAATNLSGKSSGTTATINNTFRRKSNPRQPRTNRQQTTRSELAYLAGLWGSLTETQQNSWIAAAPNFPTIKHGEIKKISGIDLFIKTNRPIVYNGNNPITTWQGPGTLPIEIGPMITAGGIGNGIDNPLFTFQVNSPWLRIPLGNWTPDIHWTGWQKASRFSFPKNRSKLKVDENAVNVDGYSIIFGEPFGKNQEPWVEGLKTKIEERFINKTTGQVITTNIFEIKAEDFYNWYNPINTIAVIGDTSSHEDGGTIFTDVLIQDSNNNFNFAVWEPFVLWTGWKENPDDIYTPMIEQIPNSAVEYVDPGNANIHFGSDPGMATPATNNPSYAAISFSVRNVNDGSIIAGQTSVAIVNF